MASVAGGPVAEHDVAETVSNLSTSQSGSNKRGRDNDDEEEQNMKMTVKVTEKAPRFVTILVKKVIDPTTNQLLGAFVFNAFCVRDPISQNAGQPAAAYIPFQAAYHADLINQQEAETFKHTNCPPSNSSTSLASTILLSDAERHTFDQKAQYVTGAHFITAHGLENVGENEWEGHTVPHTMVNRTMAEKQALLNTSYERLIELLQNYCRASLTPPYGDLRGFPARYVLRKQTKRVYPQLMTQFANLLRCSSFVTSRVPLNPHAEPIEEDVD